jgi:hypothetical protein
MIRNFKMAKRPLQLATLLGATLFFSGCVFALGDKGGLEDKGDPHTRFNHIDSQLSSINVRLTAIECKVERNRPEAYRELEFQMDGLQKEIQRLERENADLKDRTALFEKSLINQLNQESPE